jgi:geranylgeranyl reductase family protein
LTRLRRHTRDVIVVGGGPGGLAAARALASAGRSVLVLEEHTIVGEPVHCTGLLGMEAFAELDLPRETIRTVLRSARFRGAAGRTVAVDSQSVAAAVVDRAAFDRALAGLAHSAGAEIRCGHRVQGITTASDGVDVTAEAHGESVAFRARACVLACGAQYRFNRQLGLGIPRAYLQTAQLETPFAHLDSVEIDLDRAIAPSGFAWVVPFAVDGTPAARVGLMASGNASRHFGQFARALSSRFSLPASARSMQRPRLKVLPLGPVQRTYANRVVAVGDAAGLAKPTTGGGIYYSLLSGTIAADVLSECLRSDRLDADGLRAYETRWRARLGAEMRAGLAFRTLAARFDNRAVDALLELAAVDGIVPLLRRTANFNWHGQTALALLRNPGFRRIVLNSLWNS